MRLYGVKPMRLNLLIPAPLREQLNRHVERTGMSVSEAVRHAIREYLAHQRYGKEAESKQ